MNAETQLRTALLNARKLYGIDPDLVRPGAAAHHVDVTEGNLTTPLSMGNYNARIPEGSEEEIEAIKHAKTISFQCEDFRQSHHVAEKVGADIVFSTAGGVVQPDEDRRGAMVSLASAMHKANPNAQFIFSFHTEICGGAKHFTGGKMAEIYNTQGPEAELAAMTGFAQKFITEVIASGIPQDKIQLKAVKLHSGHAQHEFVKEIVPITVHNAPQT